jgi:hypothetical protein
MCAKLRSDVWRRSAKTASTAAIACWRVALMHASTCSSRSQAAYCVPELIEVDWFVHKRVAYPRPLEAARTEYSDIKLERTCRLSWTADPPLRNCGKIVRLQSHRRYRFKAIQIDAAQGADADALSRWARRAPLAVLSAVCATMSREACGRQG